MRHKPTGLTARADARSQHANRRAARAVLEARVAAYYEDNRQRESQANRQRLAGSGMRGDKVRSYRARDALVTDHRTGRKAPLKQVLAGELERLW